MAYPGKALWRIVVGPVARRGSILNTAMAERNAAHLVTGSRDSLVPHLLLCRTSSVGRSRACLLRASVR
jgi:hypothetical protein